MNYPVAFNAWVRHPTLRVKGNANSGCFTKLELAIREWSLSSTIGGMQENIKRIAIAGSPVET